MKIAKSELQPWHYDYMPTDTAFIEIEKYINSKNNAKNIVQNFYKKMGWNISKLPISLDTPGKSEAMNNGGCMTIEPNKNVRIYASISNDMCGITGLSHELGHAVYATGFDNKLLFFQKQYSSSAMTEAIAIMQESLPEKEGIFSAFPNIPASLINKMKQESDERFIIFLRSMLLNIKFEQEIYKNPTQDFAELWYKLENKFLKTNPPKKLDNAWASIPHFIKSPGYYQNYLRAEVIQFQLYDAAYNVLGPLSKNKETANFFKEHVFKYGASLTDEQILKKLTGKGFSIDSILAAIKKIRI